MQPLRLKAELLLLASICLLGPHAHADNYPARPVTIILASAAGGGPDVIARVVAERLSRLWNQPVVILNRPGAGGLVAARAMSGASPDGYTLFLPVASNFTILAQTHEK